MAGGKYGRVSLRFRYNDGLCQNGETCPPGGGFAESSFGNFSLAIGGPFIVYGNGVACRVVDIASCRVGYDCGVDSPGCLFLAGAFASTGKS